MNPIDNSKMDNSEIASLLAPIMITLIAKSSLEIEDTETFQQQLSSFIKDYLDDGFLKLAPETPNSLRRWAKPDGLMSTMLSFLGLAKSDGLENYTIKPRRAEGLSDLKNYDKTPDEFKGQLMCAPSQVEEMLEILVTMLDKLNNENAHNRFLQSQTFYQTSAALSPAILCTLSFQIASALGAHHSMDSYIDIRYFTQQHNKHYKDNLSSEELKKWQYRLFTLLGLLKPADALKDKADEAFESQIETGKVDDTLLKQFEGYASLELACSKDRDDEYSPASSGTQSPYTPSGGLPGLNKIAAMPTNTLPACTLM